MGEKLHKFAPGPWQVEGVFPNLEEGHTFEPVVSITSPGDPTCPVYSGRLRIADIPDVREKDSEEMANARLMAAAPELFAALQRMLDCHQAAMDAAQSSSSKIVDKPCLCGACDEARAAIAKAVGDDVEVVEPNPEVSDAVLACPDCDRPNQFGQVCDSCEHDRQDAIEEAR